MYIYAECEELGSTILSKNPTSGKYYIAKIAIWYYRGGSCSGVRKKYLYIIKMIFGVYVVGKS